MLRKAQGVAGTNLERGIVHVTCVYIIYIYRLFLSRVCSVYREYPVRVSIRAHHSLYTQKRVLGHTFNHVILYTSASARGAISSWTPPSLHAALCSYQGAKMTNRRGPPPAPHETRS